MTEQNGAYARGHLPGIRELFQVTDREKKIAGIRSKSYPGRVVSVHAGTVHDLLSDIRFLLSELERKDREISECQELYAAMESMWYEAMQELDREREENRKLLDAYNKVYENSMNNYSQFQSAQQDREKLIDALQTIRTDTEDPYTSEFAKKTLKQIGVNVDE